MTTRTTRTTRSDLLNLAVLSDLAPATVKRMLGGLPAVRLAQGDELDIAQSEVACCLVRSGRLALDFDAHDQSHNRTVTLVEEGDVLVPPADGWAASGPRLRCRALERSIVILVDAERFLFFGPPNAPELGASTRSFTKPELCPLKSKPPLTQRGEGRTVHEEPSPKRSFTLENKISKTPPVA